MALARFLQRQSDLSLRQGDSTAHVRMDAVNKDTIDHYFSLLRDTLTTHGLLDKPSQIYNVDETGVPFNPRLPKIITAKRRGTKEVRYRSSGRKGQITIVACANAIGQAIPSMIIYDAARLNPAWTRDEVPGTGLFCNLARKKHQAPVIAHAYTIPPTLNDYSVCKCTEAMTSCECSRSSGYSNDIRWRFGRH